MRKLLLTIIVLTLLNSPALADSPNLVRTQPADGATDVAADVGFVRFYFDRNMDMDSWYFRPSEKGVFPPLSGAGEDPWKDPLTCQLNLGQLKPGTTYAIQLNSDKKPEFRALGSGDPLPVTVMVFTTAPATESPAPAAGEEMKSTEEVEDADAPVEPSEPRGEAAAEVAEATEAQQETLPEPPAEKPAPSDDSASLFEDEPEKPDAPPAVAVPPVLVGIWTFRDPDMDVRTELREDGTFSRMTKTAEETESAEGMYRVETNVLILEEDGEQEVTRLPFRILDEHTLEVQDEHAQWHPIIREGAPDIRSVVGEWIVIGLPETRVELRFREDGTYGSLTDDGGDVQIIEGRYEIDEEEGLLVFQPTDGEPSRLLYTIHGGVLTIKGTDMKLRFMRGSPGLPLDPTEKKSVST